MKPTLFLILLLFVGLTSANAQLATPEVALNDSKQVNSEKFALKLIHKAGFKNPVLIEEGSHVEVWVKGQKEKIEGVLERLSSDELKIENTVIHLSAIEKIRFINKSNKAVGVAIMGIGILSNAASVAMFVSSNNSTGTESLIPLIAGLGLGIVGVFTSCAGALILSTSQKNFPIDKWYLTIAPSEG